ncbi:uncharacterized protein LAESUDRAFT_752231 [Laetiporus sulphureus 93-53]|uniref:Activator of Hsp90 ATPase AHSA1-like N-terminal domain-containing protein n=1 Tax=Laetiporus sulphureus 93-53 TaxID=1314785 RepID=A0A165C7K4_9APHY|nr:uncharacterized protein LAESUDRAFT_752231 [Laetiporus sulphureus 93-53]KZT02340.1 hypothetical protein LAESUDRAFT_752231 [Laetiporus sulphureus 93-53]
MATIPPSMPASTANWHWKNKTVTPWAKAWFERELPTISVKGDGEENVSISKVVDVDGDVELGQRKSKLITIYDCKVVLQWSGTASDGTEVEGKLTIPEVSHEVTLDRLSDYAYEWSLETSSSPAVDALYALARARLPTALETKFAEFPAAIIETHGKDLTISAEPSRQASPAPTGSAASKASASSSTAAVIKPAVKKAASSVNTATISVDAHFMAAADDLFDLLTNEQRIPAWTRAPAQSVAKPDTEYSLFGGSVRGKYISLTPANEIVQSWALQSPAWPDRHVAMLTTRLEQGSDSTKVTWTLSGVPLGMEEETTRNLQGYYIHGLKSIGYVQLFPYTPPPPSPSSPKRNAKKAPAAVKANPYSQYIIVILAFVVLVAAFCMRYLYE